MGLRINLLGGFVLRDAAGAVLTIGGAKQRGLLAYLAMPAGRARPRHELATLLWGQRGEDHARHSLNQALSQLRGKLPDHGGALRARNDEIWLDPGAVLVDVALFRERLGKTGSAPLAEAAEFYCGDFLATLDIREEPFEDWLLAERYELREQGIHVFRSLAEAQAAAGDIRAAVAAAKRLLDLAPLDEAAHSALIQLYARQRYPELVRLQYERCRALLQRDLGVRPDVSTEQVYRRALKDAQLPDRTTADTVTESRPAAQHPKAPTPIVVAISYPPEVVVLPFANRTDDPVQDSIAAGLTDELKIELSRFRSLSVIAGQVPIAWRAQGTMALWEARERSARYVVLGSIRRVGEQLRIGTELVDAATGRSIWAERYDRSAGDLVCGPEELSRTIAGTLGERLETAAREEAMRKPTAELAAHDYCLRGIEHHQRFTPEDHLKAKLLLERAIALNPEFALPYAWLGLVHLGATIAAAPRVLRESLDQALECTERATVLDGDQSRCYVIRGWTELHARRFEEAEAYAVRSVAMNPNDGHGLSHLGVLLAYVGRPAEGEKWLRAAIDGNRHHPGWYERHLAHALYAQGRYAEAAQMVQASGGTPILRHAMAAAAHAHAGLIDDASRHAAAVMALKSDFSASALAATEPYQSSSDAEHFLDGLRQAGLPA